MPHNQVTIKARAKINLTLDVTGKRDDGYHLVEMIMQQIDLYDLVTIERCDTSIKITSNVDYIPLDESNLAYKTAALLMKNFEISSGVHIHIEKMIPVAAGLAGGSADAAAVIIGMNDLFELGMSKQEMCDHGLKLGADVPFCIIGGTAIARGIGEVLEPIQPLENVWVVLSKPSIGVSTKLVYTNLNINNIKVHPDTQKMVEAIKRKDIFQVTQNLINVLENVTMELSPIVKEVKRKMKEYGAKSVLMSGSGPTVYALFKDKDKAEAVYKNMAKKYSQTYLVKTYSGGSDAET